MQVLLPLFYLPPISWFSVFLNPDHDVVLEQFESFPKQTYRNRCNIYGANGKLSLIIPTQHNGKRLISEIEMSMRENWKSIHWKSIKTVYQSSPFFEYYEDKLEAIFTSNQKNLFDFNRNALEIIQKILKTDKAYSLNTEYIKIPEEVNYREKFSTRKGSDFQMEEYYQIFSDKYGYLEDLSIIDLICNKGPESLTYIKNIQSK